MNSIVKLTENETIEILMNHLERQGWQIASYCLGQSKGCDIVALKDKKRLVIEVKGARADDLSPTKKRVHFSSGQIKTHFGKAIVKTLQDRYCSPKDNFAIAHPNDPAIKKAIGHLTPFLKTLNVRHFWVSVDGRVDED